MFIWNEMRVYTLRYKITWSEMSICYPLEIVGRCRRYVQVSLSG